MNVIFPVIELVDRYCIAKLKFERTGCNQEELDFYTKELNKFDLNVINDHIEELFHIHGEIWDLESSLKSGLEENIDISEIGRRAIKIRDWNRRRIETKNLIATLLNFDDVREYKKGHLSE